MTHNLPKDEAGNRYGRLAVVSLIDRPQGRGPYLWLCQCDCGRTIHVSGWTLRQGAKRSCGCRLKGIVAGFVHGVSHHPAYRAYERARHACTNKRHESFHLVGNRGIKFTLPPFHDFWAEFEPTWFEGASLIRVNGEGDYTASNVKWGTRTEQSISNNLARFATFNGTTKSLTTWSVQLGIPRRDLWTLLQLHGAQTLADSLPLTPAR